jgi:hypothetical protein
LASTTPGEANEKSRLVEAAVPEGLGDRDDVVTLL